MVIKNTYPILEYDESKKAVIMPNHAKLNLKLPQKCVFAFLSDFLEEFAQIKNAHVAAYFESATKDYPIFIMDYSGKQICLVQAPVGAAAATQIMDWLIAYGVRKIISCGCCGVLKNIPESTLLVPTMALRDEGTSYHYLSPSRFIELDREVINKIEATFDNFGTKYEEVTTWTTDGFYRETKDMVEYRIYEGCSVVEMECSALAACAKFRNIQFGQILYSADTLFDTNNWDARNWGNDARQLVLNLSIETLIRTEKSKNGN